MTCTPEPGAAENITVPEKPAIVPTVIGRLVGTLGDSVTLWLDVLIVKSCESVMDGFTVTVPVAVPVPQLVAAWTVKLKFVVDDTDGP